MKDLKEYCTDPESHKAMFFEALDRTDQDPHGAVTLLLGAAVMAAGFVISRSTNRDPEPMIEMMSRTISSALPLMVVREGLQ